MIERKWIILTVVTLFALATFAYFLLGDTISGIVVATENGEPVPFASITIGNVTTQCNSKGEFSRWLPPFTGRIMANHPFFDRFVKRLEGYDMNESLVFQLNPSSYETIVTLCQEQLNYSSHFVAKSTAYSYEYPEDGNPVAHKNETVFIITPEAQLYCQDASNTRDGNISLGPRTIVVGSDPKELGKIRISRKHQVPQVYYRGDRTDWITFSSSDDLDFEIAIRGTKDPKKLLEPLHSYGETTDFEIVPNPGKSFTGKELVGCKTFWGPKTALLGKSVTFLFTTDGWWYDIIFEDTGENPVSPPGKYHFSCLDEGSHIKIDIPQDAISMTPRELLSTEE